MLFKFYQVDRSLTRAFGYRSLRELTDEGKNVDLRNYNLIYEGAELEDDVDNVLDNLFHRFNTNFPEDYPERGRSMAVSDLIYVDDRYFFCDSFGWKDVTDTIVVD